MDNLNLFCAGVSRKLVTETAEKWNGLHPELPAIVTSGGSVDIIRRCIAGEPCDFLVSADYYIIGTMMMPDYASGYRIWAGNRMVLTGNDITAENWEEKLLAEDATFRHGNPYGDPGGYRSVMILMLADEYKPGLSDRLLNHPGRMGMERNAIPDNTVTPKYGFSYYTGAKLSGRKFALLPPVMDLSDPAYADTYAKVSFAIDDDNVVTATPIGHGLTIPIKAVHKEEARQFAKLFLEIDKEADGFLPREGVFGVDPVC